MRALLPILGALLIPAIGCTSFLELQVRGVGSGIDRKEVPPPDLRIYLLKDGARFDQATIDNLWVDDRNVLRKDLLSMQIYAVQLGPPDGQPRRVPLGKDSEDIRFIGILALLPKEDSSGPRKLVLTKSDLSRVLRVTKTHLELEK